MRSTLVTLAIALAACSEAAPPSAPDAAIPADDAAAVAMQVDASAADAAATIHPDAASANDDAAIAPDATNDLIPVGHEREMRAIWVATVSNIDFPRSTRLTPAEAQADLEAMVTRTATAGLNAIFFQVRPESDAFYASTLEPWSRFLTGTQGQDPGYDPLATLIALARRRHIEVHAWINPYRGLTSSSVQAAPTHVTRTLSAHAINYGAGVVMDPGSTEVRAHVVAVVRDLIEHYEVDGVHFDDYFYPYPDAGGTPFPDSDSYDAYRAGGGMMSLGDWRRDNVNALVRDVSTMMTQVKPTMRFGISPFGIWKNNTPPGIRGLDAFATIYCDAVTWMREGWVDYLAPQLYWPTTQVPQAYGTLAPWWASQNMGGRHLFPGHALSRLGSGPEWSIDEMREQVEITRGLRDQGAQGDVFFSYRQFAADLEGVFGLFQRTLYRLPALPPPVPRALPTPAPPTLIARAGGMSIEHAARGSLSWLVLYRSVGGVWVIERILEKDATEANVANGDWAVSAIGPGGNESLGRTVTVR